MSQHSTIGPNEWLLPGQSLFAEDGETELRMQDDGKVAVYRENNCIWQNTSTQRWNEVKGTIMQERRQLLHVANSKTMYSDNSDTPIWATNTGGRGNGNVFLTVQNDGNVVLYSGEPLWATATNK